MYNVSNGRLGRLLSTFDKNPNELPKDKRGKQHQASKTSKETLEKLPGTIKKLHKYTLHYERSKERSDNTVFLRQELKWEMVFEVSKEVLPLSVKPPNHIWFYSNATHLFPYIKVHTSSTCKCNACSLLTLQQKTDKLEIPQKRAKSFKQQLARDVKQDYCTTYDLQQVQPLPFVRENEAFTIAKHGYTTLE